MLSSLPSSRRLQQVLTADIVFLPAHPVGNWLASIDRGRFCRNEQGYRSLVERSGLLVRSSFVARSAPVTGIGKYLYLTLVPRGQGGSNGSGSRTA